MNTTQTSFRTNESMEVSGFDGTGQEDLKQRFEPNTITTEEIAEQRPSDKSLFANFKLDMSKQPGTKKIPLKEIVDLGMSKLDIYRAFTQKGKLYLPPISMCNFSYYAGILSGEKLVFTTSQIILAQVPQYKELSVEKVLAIALNNPTVMKYLPDQPNGEKLQAGRTDRSFLFNVMNTIDHNFFQAAVTEIEEKLVKHGLKDTGVIKVDLAMLSILQQYVHTHKVKHKRSSIALVKQGSRKRKRSDLRDTIEIQTVFGQQKQFTQKRLH